MKKAVIDIGSNTMKAYIYDEKLYCIEHKTLHAQLIKYVENNVLTNQGAELLFSCVGELLDFCEEQNSAITYAIATQALRSSSNSDKIIEELRRRLDISVDIISGKTEAMCDYLSARFFSKNNDSTAAVDLGGGSAQLITFNESQLTDFESFPIGATKLSMGYGDDNYISSKTYLETRNKVAEIVKHFPFSATNALTIMGGTANCAAELFGAEYKNGSYSLTTQDARKLIKKLIEMGEDGYVFLRKNAKQRAKSVFFGLSALIELSERFNAETLHILTCGVREGYILLKEREKNERL